MNWQAKHLVLPILVISFLFSCRSKDGQIGIGDNYSTIGANYTDTLSLKTSTVFTDDSIATSTRINLNGTTTYLNYLHVGQYDDGGVTGKVTASAYTQLRLTTENVDLSDVTSDSDIDSAFLYLDYQGYAYGDTTVSQTIDVFEMTSALDKDAVYFSSSTPPSISSTSILDGGAVTFMARPHTTNSDGTGRLKLAIDPAWAYHILSLGGGTSDDFVANKLHGIAIIPQGAPEGAVLRLSLLGNTKLTIYYNEDKSYGLTINSNGQGYSRIVADRSGTNYAGMTTKVSKSSDLTGEVTFMQSGVGVRTKVEIPYLQLFKEMVGDNIVINKATLYVPINSGSADNLVNSQAFYMIRTNSTNTATKNLQGNTAYVQATNYPQNISGHDLIAIYDTTSKTYQADVTDYIRDLLNQRLPNTGVFISPNGMAVGVERTIFNNANSLVWTDKMRLQIYYTIKE